MPINFIEGGKTTFSRLEQPLKALAYIFVIDIGMVIFLILIQFANTLSQIFSKYRGRFIFCNLEHPIKAPFPIEVTDCGINTFSRFEQP
ncbi:hypothetical protein AGMMS50212_09510 [Spirochaetia bacterium]|nr:hypothetical protein AGMMS50212_09510 [Spirochaetia bacterium]